MVYRFADDLIRCVHNEDALLSLRSYSASSSLSSKCMPIRCARRISQFQEYSRKGISFKYTDEVIKIIVASNYITGTSSEASCQLRYCDDNNCFLYMSLQLFAMHEPRLQAPSDYISDVFDSLDPWPQQYSCSFRFKWLELIVPWGSSVIYRPGTLLLLLLLLFNTDCSTPKLNLRLLAKTEVLVPIFVCIFLTLAPSQSMFNLRQCRPISTANYLWFEFYLERWLLLSLFTVNDIKNAFLIGVGQNEENMLKYVHESLLWRSGVISKLKIIVGANIQFELSS